LLDQLRQGHRVGAEVQNRADEATAFIHHHSFVLAFRTQVDPNRAHVNLHFQDEKSE
jgi:hypothetical protein